MPTPTWLLEGTDLEFVLEKRPRGVRDLLKKGKAWTDLFWRWYKHQCPTQSDDLQLWFTLVRRHEQTGSLQKALSLVPDAQARMKTWRHLILGDFFDVCQLLRNWLESERRKARKELEAERGAVAWYRWGVSDSKVKERLDRNMGKAIAKARSTQWETAAGGPPTMTGRTLAHMEAVLTSYTRTVKPRFMELYGHYGKQVGSGPSDACACLEGAHATLVSAEAWLREACHAMRRRDFLPTADAEKEVLAAWVEYVQACDAMGTALLEATRAVVRWAAEDTSKKIQSNMTTVHPGTVCAMVGIKLTVSVVSALLQCVSIATGAAVLVPIIATATAGLTVVLDYVEKYGSRYVADVSAKDPEVVRLHLGADYRQSSSGKTEVAAAETFKDLAGKTGAIAVPGMKWAAQAVDASGGALTQAVPFVGLLPQIGKIGEQVVNLANPQELTNTYDRRILLAMLDRAQADLIDTNFHEIQVIVHQFFPGSGRARVTVNGVLGTLRAGRFHPDDRRGALDAALRDWTRVTRDINPAFGAAVSDFAGFGPVRSFVIQHDGTHATRENVTSAVSRHTEEVGRGFECAAYVAGAPHLASVAKLAIWEARFFVSYEGEAELLGQPAFQWLVLRAKDDPDTSVYAYTEEAARALNRLSQDDPALDCLLVLQLALRLSERTFVFDGERLCDAQGAPVVDLSLLSQLCKNVDEALRLTKELEFGQPFDINNVDLPDEVKTLLLGDWGEPLDCFRRVQAITNEVDRWCIFDGYVTKLNQQPLHLVRFLRFIECDQALNQSLDKIGRLYAEFKEPTGCYLSDEELEHVEQLRKVFP